VHLWSGLQWEPSVGEFLYYLPFGGSEMVAGNGDDWPHDVLVGCGMPLVFLGEVLVVVW